MEIRFNLSEQDDINTVIYSLFDSPKKTEGKRRILYGRCFLGALTLVALLFFLFNGDIISSIIITTISLIICTVFLPKFVKRSYKRLVKKNLSNEKANGMLHTLILKHDYMEKSYGTASINIEYSEIEKIIYAYNCFRIYIRASIGESCILVPMSAFADKNEKDKFFEIIYQKAGITVLN